MKYVAKPNQNIAGIEPVKSPSVETPPVGDISIDRLIDDSLQVLYREVKNLLIMSARGKLEANDARDLRDHLKLLFELKEREGQLLKGLTDEQLQAELEKNEKV